MGRSHAKNNTTQANLTYYERSLLRQEGAARRIGADSFKPLDHCNLCLTRATSPVACPQAHVYCTECAVANLISQRAGIAAQEAEIARWEAEDERKRIDAREKARARVVTDFERGMGLAAGRAATASIRKESASASASAAASTAPSSAGSSKDAKFELKDDEVDRLLQAAEDAATSAIEAEESDARKAKLAAFWLPSLTPEAPLGPLKAVKLQPLCHVGAHPHPIARKTLLPVIFTYPSGGDKESKPSCPSCTRELSNATPAVLLASKSPLGAEAGEEGPKKKKQKKEKAAAVCGHVVCKTCADTMVKPSKRCCVCEAGIDVEDGGMIPLGKEGTGFAAAGGAIAKKATVAFRV